jgi:hypothetical protein
MNAWLCNISIACFLGLPPLLFALRYFRGRPSWWLIVPALIVIGWASWLGATVFHYEALGDRIEADPNPPAELIEDWGRDGGPMTFALLFGWVAAAVYSTVWYIVFLLACLFRRIAGGRRRPDKLNIDIVSRTALSAPDEHQ